jgi:hypothetical protein
MPKSKANARPNMKCASGCLFHIVYYQFDNLSYSEKRALRLLVEPHSNLPPFIIPAFSRKKRLFGLQVSFSEKLIDTFA